MPTNTYANTTLLQYEAYFGHPADTFAQAQGALYGNGGPFAGITTPNTASALQPLTSPGSVNTVVQSVTIDEVEYPQPDYTGLDYQQPPQSLHPWTTSVYPEWGVNTSKKKVKSVDENPNVFYNRSLLEFIPNIRGKKTDGEVGLEIECEGTHLFNSPIQWWTCHADGSLRLKDGHPPVEYVLKKPIQRDEVSKSLIYLNNQLRGAGSTIADSPRTSVHVHINMQKQTLKEVFTYICLYLLFENVLVEFSGPQRSGNLFCLRAKDAEYWVWCICTMFQNMGDLSNVCSEELRYTSCNTASLAKFGSLEFRSMRGTVDRNLIQLWVNILLRLKDVSLEFKNPSELYERYISLGPNDFLKFVFLGTDMYSVIRELKYGKSMEEGSRFVRDIASSCSEWRDKVDVPKKKKAKTIMEIAEAFSDVNGDDDVF